MPKDIDEDLIEATIRRIQAQSEVEPSAVDEDVTPEADVDASDAIEATIRRVQEQTSRARDASREAAARDLQHEESAGPAENGRAPAPPSGLDDDPIAATIRRVEEQAARARDASREAAAQGDMVTELGAPGMGARPPSTPDLDDDPIAATIRRIQAQAAARTGDESSQFAPAPLPDFDDEDDEAASQSATPALVVSTPQIELAEERDIEETPWPGRDDRLLGEPATWEIAAQRLEQGLQDNSRQVRELAARLDALLPAIEQLTNAGGRLSGLSVVPTQQADDDGWDERPVASSMQFGSPPRPPVLRDPAPHSAAARQLEEVEAPPASAAPAARLRPVESGSLDDRLPRQYRITVEDKRRGVDLVPLHRAMQGIQSVKDMSLLSYNNGVAIVLIETVGALDPEILRESVARAMARDAKIEVHNESTMVVKVQED